VAISQSGDYMFLSPSEIALLRDCPEGLSLEQQTDLKSRFFLRSEIGSTGSDRLLASRRAAKRETTTAGPSLFIIVPTLQCAHSCKYCQVSRSVDDAGYSMSIEQLDAACNAISSTTSKSITVEFQGGDPLIRFDLVAHAVRRIENLIAGTEKSLRFVVATTLHQLTEEMCSFFRDHRVYLSTSVDGPESLHNKNRPTPTRDAHQRTLAGIHLARRLIGPDSVSALMTTTRDSLDRPTDVVDEYVRLGLRDLFVRPLSAYGFAKRNQLHLAYPLARFKLFYERALDRILDWNRRGTELREVYASIILNKILSPFDAGYVDLQSPTGSGTSVLVYNYDGFVYPSDEARMLAETGDISLRLGRIGEPLNALRDSTVQRDLVAASTAEHSEDCRSCAYNQFCSPNPVDAQAQHGDMITPALRTEHCQRHLWLFDHFYQRIRSADPWTMDLFYAWARPTGEENTCAA
jgi:His-Xaa-Ser system radical SAM maturase HxsB